MAEETKETKEAEKGGAGKAVKTMLKVILGIAFLVLGIVLVITFRSQLLNIIAGGIGPFLILAGVITLAIAKD